MDIASPCVTICKIDQARKICTGCKRTLAEIAEWPAASSARKQEILKTIAARQLHH